MIYNKLFKFFENNFVRILGFFIFAIYIYFRFLRTRLPKDIPFNLSVVGFIILVEVCLIYAYIVWIYIRKSKKANEIVTIIVDALFQPLDALDDSLKNLPLIKKYYPKIFLWVSIQCIYLFNTLIFEICFFVIPRVVLISFLSLDIFYFHILHYIYYVLVPMGIILFIRRYFIYGINKYKTQLIMDLKLYVRNIWTKYEYGIHPSEWPKNYDPDDEDDDDIPPTMSLTLEIFVDYYCRKVIKKEEPPEIDSHVNTKLFFDTYNTHDETKFDIYEQKTKEYNLELQKILNIAILCAYITKNNSENKMLKRFKIVVYSTYLICWMYILSVSIHTLNIDEFMTFINSTWETSTEPFTDITMSTMIVPSKLLIKMPRRCATLCTSVIITIVKRNTHEKKVVDISKKFMPPNPLTCQGVQCGIRQSINTTRPEPNNNQRVYADNAAYERTRNQQQLQDRKMTGEFKSILDRINRTSLENPSGAQESITTTVTTEQEVTNTNDIHKRLYQEAVTPLQQNSSKECPKTSKEHQLNMTKVNEEFINAQAKQQPSENNPDGCRKPSTIKRFINNTKEPLTPQENNVKNNTDISQTEPLAVSVTSDLDSDTTPLPLLPPLLPTTSLDTNTNATTVSDVNIDSSSIKESPQLHKSIQPELLEDLFKYDLMTIENNETKFTQKFYQLLQKDLAKIKLSGFDLSMPFNLELGLLDITKEKERNTIFLDGKQNHVIVICILQGDQKLAVGMLTSTKENTTLLSNYQPFDTDENMNKPKKQYYATFEKPLFLENNTFYRLLDFSNQNYCDGLTQQELGQIYLNKPEIKQLLIDNILRKSLSTIDSNKGYVDVYNGEGITMKDIENVIHQDEIEREKKLNTMLQKYNKWKNQFNASELLKKINYLQKTEDAKTKELFQQKIREHENKNK